MNEITLAQLTAEFERLGLNKDDDGLTSDEYAQRWAISKNAAMARLHQANALGWLQRGERKTRRIDGKESRTPVYRIVLPAKKKSAKK